MADPTLIITFGEDEFPPVEQLVPPGH